MLVVLIITCNNTVIHTAPCRPQELESEWFLAYKTPKSGLSFMTFNVITMRLHVMECTILQGLSVYLSVYLPNAYFVTI